MDRHSLTSSAMSEYKLPKKLDFSKRVEGQPVQCLVLVAEASVLSLSRKDWTGPVLFENSLFFERLV